MPEDEAIKVIHSALDSGVNFIDTAEAYVDNAAERLLGKAVASWSGGSREDIVIASKFGKHEGENSVAYTAVMIEAALQKTLAALEAKYIDLYQVHWASNVADMRETVECLENLKSEGKIRHYGVCNFGPKQLAAFMEAGGKPVTNQIPYNLLWRAIEYEILPLCIKHNIGVLTYSSLQQGLLTGKFLEAKEIPEGRRRSRHFPGNSTTLSRHGGEGCEDLTMQTIADVKKACVDHSLVMATAACQWLLQQEGVSCLLVGASSIPQVDDNISMICGESALSIAAGEDLTKATDALKKELGSDPDQWAKTSRVQ